MFSDLDAEEEAQPLSFGVAFASTEKMYDVATVQLRGKLVLAVPVLPREAGILIAIPIGFIPSQGGYTVTCADAEGEYAGAVAGVVGAKARR